MRIGVDTNVLDGWESLVSFVGTEHSIEISLDVMLEYLICGERARSNLLALNARLGHRLAVVDLSDTLRWEASPRRGERPVYPIDVDALAAWDLAALPALREKERAKEQSRLGRLVGELEDRDALGKMDPGNVESVLAAHWAYVRDKLPDLSPSPRPESYKAHLLHVGSVMRLGLGAGRADDAGEECLRDPTTKRNRNNEMDGRIMCAYSYADVVVSADEYFRRVLSRLVGSFGFQDPLPRSPAEMGLVMPRSH